MTSLFKKTALAVTLGVGIFALAGCTKHADSAKVTPSDGSNAATVIGKITKDQFNIDQHFQVKGHGLTGYVVEPKQGGQPVIFYSNDKTGDVFYGMLFDKDGNNLTEQYMNKHIKPLLAKKLFKTVDNTDSFLIGKADAPHQMYVVGEPNCSICHKLYTDLKPFVDKGDLSIRWIMTAFLRADSTGKAAAILQAKDPAEMLAQDESKSFDMSKEEGAIQVLPNDKITDATKAALKANMKFMAENGIRGTPAIFYMDTNGQAKRIDGYPQEKLDTLIKSVAMLPVTPAKTADTKPMTKLVPEKPVSNGKDQTTTNS